MAKKPKQSTEIVSHWNFMIEGLQASPQEFFSQVEAVLKTKQMEDAKSWRTMWSEGGVFSHKREYLQVQRKDYLFDICGAPFGNGFFVSWWLGSMDTGLIALLSRIPFVGILIRAIFKPATYYRFDTAAMFQGLVHSAVMEVVDSMTTEKGVRAVPKEDRNPVMRDLL